MYTHYKNVTLLGFKKHCGYKMLGHFVFIASYCVCKVYKQREILCATYHHTFLLFAGKDLWGRIKAVVSRPRGWSVSWGPRRQDLATWQKFFTYHSSDTGRIYIKGYLYHILYQKSSNLQSLLSFFGAGILRTQYPNFRDFKIYPYPILYHFFNVQCPIFWVSETRFFHKNWSMEKFENFSAQVDFSRFMYCFGRSAIGRPRPFLKW
jgi:hypothetical protein